MAKEHPQSSRWLTPQKDAQKLPEFPLSFFACPNPDYAEFNHFAAGNLSICERMGKDKAIRQRFCRYFGVSHPQAEGLSSIADERMVVVANANPLSNLHLDCW